MSNNKILITVPHAKCIPSEIRMCDLRAEEAANIFYNTLKNRINVDIVKNDVIRSEMDGNRYESRDSKFRTKIRESIQESIQNYCQTIILDVHSYANTLESFGWNFDSDFTGIIPKIVFIAPRRYYKLLKTFAQNYYSPNDILVYYMSNKDDILVEIEELGSSGILIEFNEDKSYFKSDEVNKFISQFSSFILNDMLVKEKCIHQKLNIMNIHVFKAFVIVFIILLVFYICIFFIKNITPNIFAYQ